MSRLADDDETVRKRSGWWIPLGVFVVTFVLSAMFLLLYLAPTAPSLFEEQVMPTSRGDIIALKVSGHPFYVPANYLLYASTRQGGERREIAIFALLPEMTGWSNWDSEKFSSNTPESRVVYITIHRERLKLSEADKLKRVYFDYVVDRRGTLGPFGLQQFTFRADSGYHAEDLYVGQSERGPVVLRCVQLSHDVPSPSCLRETILVDGVSLTYRFKRSHLSEWRDITANVDRLIDNFQKPAGTKG
jgi:hypothetical protein